MTDSYTVEQLAHDSPNYKYTLWSFNLAHYRYNVGNAWPTQPLIDRPTTASSFSHMGHVLADTPRSRRHRNHRILGHLQVLEIHQGTEEDKGTG